MGTCSNPRCSILLQTVPVKDDQDNEYCGENCRREARILKERAQAAAAAATASPPIQESISAI